MQLTVPSRSDSEQSIPIGEGIGGEFQQQPSAELRFLKSRFERREVLSGRSSRVRCKSIGAERGRPSRGTTQRRRLQQSHAAQRAAAGRQAVRRRFARRRFDRRPRANGIAVFTVAHGRAHDSSEWIAGAVPEVFRGGETGGWVGHLPLTEASSIEFRFPQGGNRACLMQNRCPVAHPSAAPDFRETIRQCARTLREASCRLRLRYPRPCPYLETNIIT